MEATVTGAPALGGLRAATVGEADWQELEACPICGAGDLLEVARIEGESPGVITCACPGCELVFMGRRPSARWFERFYASEWDRGGRAKGAGRAPRVETKVVDFCAERLKPGAAVLDAGAGFGDQLLGFRERGYEAHGLEASEHRAAYVREELGIPCLASPLETVELERRFDLVYLQHVLEHLSDPRRAIEAAGRLLTDGGMVYIAVPNLWHEHPPQTFHFAPHQSVFTERALTLLLERAGFRVLRSVVSHELQVLATRPGGADAGAVAASTDFPTRLESWVGAAFGTRPGRFALVWFRPKDPQREFEAARPRGRAAPALVMRAHTIEKRLPPAPRELWRRLAPGYVSARSLRMLPVRIGGVAGLPLVIRYDGPAPVWVK